MWEEGIGVPLPSSAAFCFLSVFILSKTVLNFHCRNDLLIVDNNTYRYMYVISWID